MTSTSLRYFACFPQSTRTNIGLIAQITPRPYTSTSFPGHGWANKKILVYGKVLQSAIFGITICYFLYYSLLLYFLQSHSTCDCCPLQPSYPMRNTMYIFTFIAITWAHKNVAKLVCIVTIILCSVYCALFKFLWLLQHFGSQNSLIGRIRHLFQLELV